MSQQNSLQKTQSSTKSYSARQIEAEVPHVPEGLPIDLSGLTEADLRRYLPDGVDLPESIPAPIFLHALGTYFELRRLDMQVLSAETGVARRTLYRRVRDRNHLLGEIHWYNARLIFAEGLAQSTDLKGASRLLAVYAHFLKTVQDSPQLQRALRDEPDNTLTILTTKNGSVHGRVVAFLRRFLEVEAADGHFNTDLPLDALAFAIVRMGESFLYSGVLTGEPTDYRFSVEMIGRLLRPDQIRRR